MEKILTITIAAYNVQDYLENALDSLVCSYMDQLEVLIENDGSTDKTQSIAQRYEQKYPNTFKCINKENGGYGSTINNSIEIATGKYFKQLDGDDWFENSNLDPFIELLSSIDVDRVLTPFIRFTEGSEATETVDFMSDVQEGKYDIDTFSFTHFVNMHSSTFRTSILKKMNHRLTHHCLYTDLELVSYPISLEHTMYVTHAPLYVYRLGRDGQSISRESIVKHYKEHERVLWHLFSVFDELDSESKKEYMRLRISIETYNQARYICFLEDTNQGYQEMKNFIVQLKSKNKDLLERCKEDSRLIRALCITPRSYFALRKNV